MNITEEDKFVKNAMVTASVYKPGDQFTSNLMSKIEGIGIEKSKQLKTSPLISTTGWVIITIVIAIIFTILLLSEPTTINFNYFSDYINKFDSISFVIPVSISKVFLIGLSAFIFFFIIEIILITRKTNKSKIIV